MLLWFAVAAPIVVAEVFRSPMIDYRLVAVGALLPLLEVAVGRPFVLHTLVGPVIALAVVMAVTVNRRLVRRRALGVPIGMMLHLVLDATWSQAELFWWPAFGWGFEADSVPELSRPLLIGIALDVVALGLAAWAWRRYDLDRRANRDLLIRSGHLARTALG